MKKIAIFVLGIAFAAGLAGGIQAAVAESNSNTNTNTPPPSNGNTNTGSTVRRITWGQLHVLYLEDADKNNKNAE
jgi:hypothetical protein